MPTSRRARIAIGVVAFCVVSLLFGPRFIVLYTDWLWFGEVGYRGVWATVLFTRLILFFGVTAAIGLVIFAALLCEYRSRPLFVDVAVQGKDPIGRANVGTPV